jgi:hypothetical protein
MTVLRSVGARFQLVIWLALLTSCARPRSSATVVDSRDLAVYRVVAESLYLAKALGRPVAIVNRTLDTVCDRAVCAPIGKRWGLDSLWWARDDAILARQIRDLLLARAGKPLAWSNQPSGNSRIIVVEQSALPATLGDTAAWRAFQSSTAVAALQFSPVGYAPDGSRALVVIRMRCGPRCGHLLTASLLAKSNRWAIGDLLLVSSDG